MDKNRFQQIQELFTAALEHPPESRAEFLRVAASGDPELVGAVEKLLASYRDAGDFLEIKSSQRETQTLSATRGYVGCLLKNRYSVSRELGRGGFGIVYLGHDTHLHDKLIVIKVLHQKLDRSGWFQKKFQQECEALARINHPGVVGVLDQGEAEDNMPFLVMEFVDGVTLRSVLTERGMDFKRIAALLPHLGRALDAAHDQGVYHRDLKPENILLRDLGNGQELPVIIDFGVATVVDSKSGGAFLTKVAGSCPYMAPEQLHGRPEAASDIYALGVIIYEMLTGRRPFLADSPIDLDQQQKAGIRLLPGELRSGLSRVVDDLVLRALSLDPRERPQHASDFTDALATALLTADVTVGEVSETGPPRRVAFGAAALLLAVTGAFILWLWTSRVPALPQARPNWDRIVSYFVVVQQYRNGKPFQEPFRLAGEMLFPMGYHIRLMFSSPQPGYLYLINEGPVSPAGTARLNVLYPSPSAYGSALLAPADAVPIPSAKDYFEFDEQQGEERLWMIWADAAVAELEAVKKRVNEQEMGTIGDRSEAAAVRGFLYAHGTSSTEVLRDGASRKTILRGKGKVLVYLIKLEHH
jgi:serine/threonine protein kinase